MRRLRRRAWSGVAWSSLEIVGGNVIGGVFFLILVRLLTPEIFGLMAAAAVFLAAADILMEQGLGKAVIQREDLRPDHIDTAFWAQVAIGLLVCGLGALAAPWLAAMYRRPELVPVIRVILLVIPLSALSAMQEALLLRTLNFKATAKRRLCADLAGGATAVALAVAGYGVWALVAQKVVEQAAGVVLLWASSAWRPGFAVTWIALRELTEFSIHLFFQRGLDVIKRRADQFLIGVYLGPAALGLYAMAVRAVTIVIELFVRTFAKFSLPLFARLQTADNALKRAYEASLFAGCVYGLPAAAGLIVLAPEIVRVGFGGKWTAVTPLLQVLSLQVFSKSISSANTSVILAKGYSRFRLIVAAVYASSSFALVWLLVGKGILAVGIVNVVCTIAVLPLEAWLVAGLIGGMKPVRYVRLFIPPAAGLLAMLLVIVPSRAWMSGLVSAPIVLVATAGIGAATHAATLWFASGEFRQATADVLAWIGTRLRRRTAPATVGV